MWFFGLERKKTMSYNEQITALFCEAVNLFYLNNLNKIYSSCFRLLCQINSLGIKHEPQYILFILAISFNVVVLGFSCNQCGRIYTLRCNMLRHRRLECGKEPQFLCPHCPHKCKRKENLVTHVAMKHHIRLTI